MNLDLRQIQAKPRRIGKTQDGDDVFEMVTKGGLTIIEAADGKTGRKRTLGLGPHRALARHVARQQAPGLELTELSKSEAVGPEYWSHLIGACTLLTRRAEASRG